MIVKKILETYIDISDPKDIFSPNHDEMILKRLASKFVGICYMSCYILKINKLIRRSYIYMKDTLDGDTFTSVMFEVDAIIYTTNEIINGCKIIKKEPNGIIHGKSEYAGIQLVTQPSMSIFKEGDFVPVIVKRVRYNVNQTAISVSAIPFMPISRIAIYYNITTELSKPQTDELASLIELIKEEESKINSMKVSDKKIYEFFADLLSIDVHKNAKDSKSKPYQKYKTINISKVLDIKPALIFRQHNKYDDNIIYYIEPGGKSDSSDNNFQSRLSSILEEPQKEPQKESQKESHTIVDISAYISLNTILSEYLMNLQTLINFVIQYPTFDEVQASKHIWKMYSTLKR